MNDKYKGYFILFLMSLLGGLFVAYAFAVTVDKRIEFDIIARPAAFPIATMIGIIGGLVMSPVAIICLKNKNLIIAVPVIVVLVAVLTTGLNLITTPKAGLPGSFIAAVIVLFVWRRYGPVKSQG